jgi:hypothetical protein
MLSWSTTGIGRENANGDSGVQEFRVGNIKKLQERAVLPV